MNPQRQATNQAGDANRNFSTMRLPRFTSGKFGPQINSAKAMNAVVDRVNVLNTLRVHPVYAGRVDMSDSNATINLQATQDQLDQLSLAMESVYVCIQKLWEAVYPGTKPPLYGKFSTDQSVQSSGQANLAATIEAFS